MSHDVITVGGGLAGSEAAYQIARRGVPVELYEMRPGRMTPAHKTPHLAELVCSNSFRSNELSTAAGLLKEELRLLDSLIIRVADSVRVDAGGALAVGRDVFAKEVTQAVESLAPVRIIREEMPEIPTGGRRIVTTGPLT